MVLKRFTLTVCDICGSQDDVVRCKISIGKGSQRSVDLCAVHIVPIREALGSSRRKTGTEVSSIPVVSLDQLESGKLGTPLDSDMPLRAPETALSREKSAPRGGRKGAATPTSQAAAS